jgi:protein-L-isoaspartate(D-aspartate) O-methyltransferase
MIELGTLRRRMVDEQLVRRGIDDPRVLEAFLDVPRDEFVPPQFAQFAYDDSPLPIGGGQTISQPYIVALTIAALSLRGGERVLEIGTGSGYAAALLGHIAAEVYTVERLESLARDARDRLRALGRHNVAVLCGDGSLGWPEHAPYDAIAVAAGGPKVPDALVAQLAIGGRLVIPVGPDVLAQQLVRVARESATRARQETLADVRFVPLIGEQAWQERSSSDDTQPTYGIVEPS